MVRPSVGGIAIVTARLRDVHFATDDRLDAGFGGRVVETNRAEQIAVVGDRDRGHAILRGRLGQRFVIAGAVEEAEPGMQMKMNELRHVHSVTPTRSSREASM